MKPKFIAFPNKDKGFHESWRDKGTLNLANFPHPFRACFIAKPNCGKTTTALNFILHQDPDFERVVVVHHDPEATQEYNDIGAEITDQIPSKDDLDASKKQLVIIDDLFVKKLPKQDEAKLDRLFGYNSTHKNCSVIITCQDYSSIPPNIRRLCNIFCIWKIHDRISQKLLSKKVGLEEEDLRTLFKTILTGDKDFLCVDMTDHSPALYRKNLFQPIKISGEEDM
jgi:hypothetical protein